MSDIKNLINAEAIVKIKELAMASNICMFTTGLVHLPLNTRPMGTQQVDEEGNLWFFSSRYSHKNADIMQDNRVQLFYANTGKYEYLSIYGVASVVENRQKIDELWDPIAKAWFKDGKDDPNLTLLKVIPKEAYYWDTQSNKMVSSVKILASMVSGVVMDDGVEGTLAVS